MQMNAGYDAGKAMCLLAQSYSASGDTENANTWTERVQTEYPNIDTSGGGDSSGEDASE